MPQPLDASKYLPQILEELKDHTKSIQEIADKVGVSYSWVYTTLRKLHIPHGRVQGKQVTPEQEKLIVDMTIEGRTTKEICEATGFCDQTIGVYRKKHGLTRRQTWAKTHNAAVRRQQEARRKLKRRMSQLNIGRGPRPDKVADEAADQLSAMIDDIVEKAIARYVEKTKDKS